jgi:N-acetylmuramoyl-L-alanine amidase
MKARIEVLVGCGLAVLVSLVMASVITAHAHLTEEAAPSRTAVTAVTDVTDGAGGAATPTAAPPGAATSVPAPEGVESTAPHREIFPAPKEAAPVTSARAVQGPGVLLQRQPTPRPRRPTIILDPGHGRGDPGAVHYAPDGEVDLTEAESNLAVAEHLRRFLEEKGYDVYVTRAGYGKPLGPRPLTQLLIAADLWARVHLAEAVDGDLFVSLHSNGSVNPKQSGVEIWYCGQHQYGAESARLAELALDAALAGLDDYGYDAVRRGTQEDSTVHHSDGFCQFLVTREVNTPAILTELLFLTNDADAAVLKDDAAREAMAHRLAEAIDQFIQERQGG